MFSNLYLPSYFNDFYNTVECPFHLSIMFGNWFILAYRTSAFSFSDPPSSAFDLGCESLILWRFWRHWRIFDCDFPWPHSKAFRISNFERQLFRSAVVHTVTCTLYRAVKYKTNFRACFTTTVYSVLKNRGRGVRIIFQCSSYVAHHGPKNRIKMF